MLEAICKTTSVPVQIDSPCTCTGASILWPFLKSSSLPSGTSPHSFELLEHAIRCASCAPLHADLVSEEWLADCETHSQMQEVANTTSSSPAASAVARDEAEFNDFTLDSTQRLLHFPSMSSVWRPCTRQSHSAPLRADPIDIASGEAGALCKRWA